MTTARAAFPLGVSQLRARPGWPVMVGFLAVATILGSLSRATVIHGTEFAAVWPSAGVTVLWLLVRRAAPLSIDTAAMFGAMLAGGLLTGIAPSLALALASLHTLQTVIVVVLLRTYVPELWGCGGQRALDSPRLLAAYLGCIAAGVAVSSVMMSLLWLVARDDDLNRDVLLWAARNACAVILVTTAGLMLFQYLAQPRPRPRLWEGTKAEFAAACLTSVAVYVIVFVWGLHALLFLVLVALIWCGVRFGTLMNSLHVLVLGYVAVLATVGGRGPFVEGDPIVDILLVQLFVVATAAMGLALSTGLDERSLLHRELQQTSDEMTYQAQLLHAVVNSMAEGLAVVDDAGRWLLRNPSATRVGGLAGDLRSLLSRGPDGRDPLALALTGETVRDMELRVDGPPGEGRILAVSAAPLPRDSVTGRARALLIFRDATIEHARRVDLTAFASVVAHDLRNPLAAVESWTEMMAAELEEGDAEPGLVRRYVDRVGSGTHRMKALIEDLLDRATHESALQLRRVDLGEVVREVAREHGANGHVVVGEIPMVHADPAQARQLIDNLLGNALKFVPEGKQPAVTVSGRRTGSGTVCVTVADRGIGLPADSHERVFEERHRVHPEYDGRGLGLTICRRIVERHGGTISAHDNPHGRGVCIAFTLPSAE